MRADGLAECQVAGQADGVQSDHVQLDEPLALLLGDVQVAVDCDEVREAAKLPGETIRPAEGLGRECRQVIDVLWLACAEERLEERVGQDTAVEGVLETVQRLLATGVLVKRRHWPRIPKRPSTEQLAPSAGAAHVHRARSARPQRSGRQAAPAERRSRPAERRSRPSRAAVLPPAEWQAPPAGLMRYFPGVGEKGPRVGHDVPDVGEEGIVRSRDYGPDVLAAGRRRPGQRQLPQVAAERGLVVEDGAGQFCGAVVCCEKDAVTLEDSRGRQRVFPLSPGAFLLEGKPVMLVRPRPAGPPAAAGGGARAAARTASGSVAAPQRRAMVARASRIYVEGRHDAELVERIWGDDLRDAGVVVEYLGGIDDLPAIVDSFSPGPARRLGVLVDHLVTGSKETRITARVRSPHVLITGHPFIDVWAAVKPSVLGIRAWPTVPPGQPWKEGVLRAIGWPEDTAAAWQRILRSVACFADLEPAFLGRVEELIDFVTAPGSG